MTDRNRAEEHDRKRNIDASELTGEDRPEAAGEWRPGSKGKAGGSNRVTVPDTSGRDNSSSMDQEP